jgi:hypothetical protein
MEELIESNEKILLQEVKKTLKTGKSYDFAIDLTNDPYYGKIDPSNEKYVIGGQAKPLGEKAKVVLKNVNEKTIKHNLIFKRPGRWLKMLVICLGELQDNCIKGSQKRLSTIIQ